MASLSSDILRILREANAGYNFDNNGGLINSNYYVNPKFNEDNIEYINARGEETESVLKNSDNLDYTNEVNKYLRLLMPKYTRRVEVEDLNRNFWVISQVISAICKNLVISENVHFEIVPLTNGKNYGYMKYDNFDISNNSNYKIDNINWDNSSIKTKWENLIKDRMSYLKETYPNSDLVILPVIRYENYYNNYYRREVYLGIYKYTKSSSTEQFYWFYTYKNNTLKTTPIISEITIDKEKWLFHLNEDQNDLQFYWCYGFPTEQQSDSEHAKAYVTALRSIPTFNSEDNITIIIEDAIGKALLAVHNENNIYKETYSITKQNGKYVWSRNITHTKPIITSGITPFHNVGGFYLGELSSDRSIMTKITNYDLDIIKYSLRPVVPSMYQIEYMRNNKNKIAQLRNKQLSDNLHKWLPNTRINNSPLEFYDLFYDTQTTSYISSKDSDKEILTQYGEDEEALRLKMQELRRNVDFDNKKIKLYLFRHPMLLQKIGNGSIKGITPELKNVLTVHYNEEDTPELQVRKNIYQDGTDSYLVYEYDGYLTKTSSNTGTSDEYCLSSMGEKTGKFINMSTPRRDRNPSYFNDSTWSNYKDSPLEMIVVDNGSIPATPSSSDSNTTPRFSTSLEEYIYGAILCIPWNSNENRCYKFGYDLFENALQDSSVFWRGKFSVKKDEEQNQLVVGDESYGRWHKIYTNAQYYANTNDENDMIIKITNIGITFGPHLNTYLSEQKKPTTQNTKNVSNNIPSEYKNGVKQVNATEYANYINFDSSKTQSYYYNNNVPKHTSPLAPVWAYGWPIQSTDQKIYAWESSSLNNFDMTAEIPEKTSDNYERYSLKHAIEKYLDMNNQNNTFTIPYKPLVTKGNTFSKRGYSGSSLFINSSSNINFVCAQLASELNNIIANKSSFSSGIVDLFTKPDSDTTLNEGKFLDNTQYKFYGFTTVVHTVYVKINLNDTGNCEYAICNLSRIKKDYRPNIDNNEELLWNKKWTSTITGGQTQQLVETLINNDYELKQSTGDFVGKTDEEGAPNVVIFDFSKYPSNGMTTILNVDPTPSNIYTHTGNLAPQRS